MKRTYQNGAIIINDNYFADAIFHTSNERISVIFDGKGAIVGYALANEKDMMNGCISLFRQNNPIDIYVEKTVAMIGRSQTITIHFDNAQLKIVQFLDSSLNGVFCSYELISDNKNDLITVCLDLNKNMRDAVLLDKKELRGRDFCFGASAEISFADLNNTIYIDITANKTVYSFLSCGENDISTLEIVSMFNHYEQKMRNEIDTIYLPKGLNEEQKALFYSAYFCSLQNYKCLGEYKAFMAGHHYLLPMRSYYRDSYYTVLPMYRQRSELVKEQIITLAKGISPNGDCPSAVKSDYSEWWGNHYDSPSFLSMMLYDYVKHTNDYSILSFSIDGISVFEKAERAIIKLSKSTDETSLIYKEGPYNQRDWADEVNRNGYVTYNEILYARALFCLSKLSLILGDSIKAQSYMRHFEKVKQAINDILWDDTLGYYVNFKEKDFVEKNLSIDTCLAVLFGISDDKKSLSLLKNMENILETRNNKEQKAGDYGVMCVYPFYSRAVESRNKSSQPYYYHNGGNWPYLCAMYAAAKRKCGMEYRYALESWFDYNVKRGNYTPIEFFSPPQKDGSLLQAWSGCAAFVMDEDISRDFWD